MPIEMKVPPITMGPMDEPKVVETREGRALRKVERKLRRQAGVLYAVDLFDLAKELLDFADKVKAEIPTAEPLFKAVGDTVLSSGQPCSVVSIADDGDLSIQGAGDTVRVFGEDLKVSEITHVTVRSADGRTERSLESHGTQETHAFGEDHRVASIIEDEHEEGILQGLRRIKAERDPEAEKRPVDECACGECEENEGPAGILCKACYDAGCRPCGECKVEADHEA